MNSWGMLLIIGIPALAILIGIAIRVSKHPKKKLVQTYGKPKKNNKSKKKSGKSH
jgi:hypothetical protein